MWLVKLTGGEKMGSMIEIKENQSARLQQIASEKGVTPNALLEEALELLFQQADREQAAREEQAFLSQLQAEGNVSTSARTRPPFRNEEITITHKVPADPTTLRQFEA